MPACVRARACADAGGGRGGHVKGGASSGAFRQSAVGWRRDVRGTRVFTTAGMEAQPLGVRAAAVGVGRRVGLAALFAPAVPVLLLLECPSIRTLQLLVEIETLLSYA